MKWFVLDGLSEMVCHSGMDEMDHNGGIPKTETILFSNVQAIFYMSNLFLFI